MRWNTRAQVVRTAQSRRVQNDRGTGWLPSTRRNHPKSAIEPTWPGTERRARTTTDTLVYEAKNGTYACARVRQACLAWGGWGHAANRRSEALSPDYWDLPRATT